MKKVLKLSGIVSSKLDKLGLKNSYILWAFKLIMKHLCKVDFICHILGVLIAETFCVFLKFSHPSYTARVFPFTAYIIIYLKTNHRN